MSVTQPRFIFTVCLFLLLSAYFHSISLSAKPSKKSQITGKVVSVIDGDTLKVLHDNRTEKIRLSGIDCPEKKQPFGQKAKQFASDLAFNKVVTVVFSKKDRYGRILGEVLLPDNKILNNELVTAGFAWWYRKYSKDKRLELLEAEARKEKRGFWSNPNPTPPWEWRKHKRSKKKS